MLFRSMEGFVRLLGCATAVAIVPLGPNVLTEISWNPGRVETSVGQVDIALLAKTGVYAGDGKCAFPESVHIQLPANPGYRGVRVNHRVRFDGDGGQSTIFEVMNRSPGQPGQRRFLLSFCASRAFTSFLISAVGSGLSVGKEGVLTTVGG